MNRMLPALLVVTCLSALPAFADMVHITADRDTTLGDSAHAGDMLGAEALW